jgi:hypothetical protein
MRANSIKIRRVAAALFAVPILAPAGATAASSAPATAPAAPTAPAQHCGWYHNHYYGCCCDDRY